LEAAHLLAAGLEAHRGQLQAPRRGRALGGLLMQERRLLGPDAQEQQPAEDDHGGDGADGLLHGRAPAEGPAGSLAPNSIDSAPAFASRARRSFSIIARWISSNRPVARTTIASVPSRRFSTSLSCSPASNTDT